MFLDAVGGEAEAARIGELVKAQGLIGHAPAGYAANEVHHAIVSYDSISQVVITPSGAPGISTIAPAPAISAANIA